MEESKVKISKEGCLSCRKTRRARRLMYVASRHSYNLLPLFFDDRFLLHHLQAMS